MQNNAKQCKNDLFEDIEFQEIEEKPPEFGEFQQENAFPARVIEWEIPHLGKTAKKEARKFRVYPIAVWIGHAIAYVLVILLSLAGQLAWFFVQIFFAALSGLFMSLSEGFMSGHGYGQRHTYRPRQRQDIDPLDVPTGWDAKGQAYVRKKMRERERQRQRQGHVNNVNVNVNVNIENH